VKLAALALDFDGTLSFDGRLPASVADAIGEARGRGVTVILVTGRRLDDLHHSAGPLHCFDAIVGENGAVLEFPARERRAALAPAPNPAFVEALRQHGVSFAMGTSIVETDASESATVLRLLRQLHLPLVMAFNRSRLMVLPPAVAKSTGLREVLRTLRLSVHNTIGIGDAENDHDMLDACEVGVAVSWGSAALKAIADEVIEGDGPDAVAAYIRRVSRQARLSGAQMGRRSLLLGYEAAGRPVRLALRGRSILIGGEPGSGKSALAGLLCEQLILQGYSLCVIDPEGDFAALRGLPGVVVLGGEDPLPNARELTRTLQYPDVSVIIDLSRTPHADKVQYVRTVLPLINALRRRTGLPHKILVDEAHYFLWASHDHRLIDPDLAGYVVVTYRLSSVSREVQVRGEIVAISCRETDTDELASLAGLCPGLENPVMGLATLQPSEAALLPTVDEAGGIVRRFVVAQRLTSHVRHRQKYLDVPIGDAQAFVFGEGTRPRPRARTLREFLHLLATVDGAVVRGHLDRQDFSRWIEHVFRDGRLAARVRALELQPHDQLPPTHAAEAIAQAIRARYEPANGSLAHPDSHEPSGPGAGTGSAE
jgi:hydroxymethylpyrimidine pyrophosphatase-like HAD family hydrolase